MKNPSKILEALGIIDKEPQDEELILLTEEFARAVIEYAGKAYGIAKNTLKLLGDEKVLEIIKETSVNGEIPVRKIQELYTGLVEVYESASKNGREEVAWRYLGFASRFLSEGMKGVGFLKMLKNITAKEATLPRKDSNLLDAFGYSRNFYLYAAGVEVLSWFRDMQDCRAKTELLENLSYYAPLKEDLLEFTAYLERLSGWEDTRKYALGVVERFKYAPYLGLRVLKTAAGLLEKPKKARDFLELILNERDFDQIARILRIYTFSGP